MSKFYRSPITNEVVTVEQYMEEWHSFIDPLEKKYGLVVTAYDSDIRCSREANRGKPTFFTETVDLPLWFVKELIASKPV